MKRILIIIILIISSFLLTGCFEKGDINKYLFVTSIGIDYDELNQEYIVYYHVTNPFTLTTIQSAGSQTERPFSIATGKGNTFFSAMVDILESTPQNIDLSHVQTYVLSMNFLKYYNIIELSDMIRTNPKLFPTPTFYVTDSDIIDIFSITNTEGLSPLYTILANVRATIPYDRVKYVELAAIASSSYRTFGFPIITASRDVWQTGSKHDVSISLSGKCYMSQNGDRACLKDDNYPGLFWLNKLNNFRTEFNNYTLFVYKYKYKIKHIKDNKFLVKIRFTARIAENFHELGTEQIKYTISTKIAESLNELFEETRTRNIDIYSLDDILYRKNKHKEESILPTAKIYYDIDFKIIGY